MMVSKIAAGMALLGLVGSPAYAQRAGASAAVARVVTTSGEVFIARDGKLLPAASGQALFNGDRVVTRARSKAQIAMSGCTVALPSTSILPVSESCATAKTFSASTTGLQGANAMKGSTAVVAVLALAAIIGGAIIAFKGRGRPTSP